MDRLLKDYLVEHRDENGKCYSLTCTVCGSTWMSSEISREDAVKQAGVHCSVCRFCGRVACGKCFTDVESIHLCVLCAAKLKARLDEG